ncbi:transposable element Tcb2 transposase [Trichonephila clavipes]|nr:transposable element Tcb2 transposase [Trichonephila clavipes]
MSRFSLSSDCRRQLIWRESGTAYRPENIQEKDRYPTCSIMVWAGIMINGRTRLHVVANGTMTGQRYIDEVLLPHVRLFRGAVGDKFVFMDDNATCHRTLAVQDCLDSEDIQRLVWSARSPDLNPIENVWDALGRQFAGRNYPPTSKNTLIRALTEEWDKLPHQLLDNVVQSMDCHGSGSDVVQSGRPIFNDFFQHLLPYIGNNTANVVFQMVKSFVAYPHRPMTLHSPTESSLAVLNHKILEANSQVQNVKLGGHQTCLSINRMWHELCDMLHRLVGTTAPGHHDCSIQE